jgi:hypothetical protein
LDPKFNGSLKKGVFGLVPGHRDESFLEESALSNDRRRDVEAVAPGPSEKEVFGLDEDETLIDISNLGRNLVSKKPETAGDGHKKLVLELFVSVEIVLHEQRKVGHVRFCGVVEKGPALEANVAPHVL